MVKNSSQILLKKATLKLETSPNKASSQPNKTPQPHLIKSDSSQSCIVSLYTCNASTIRKANLMSQAGKSGVLRLLHAESLSPQASLPCRIRKCSTTWEIPSACFDHFGCMSEIRQPSSQIICKRVESVIQHILLRRALLPSIWLVDAKYKIQIKVKTLSLMMCGHLLWVHTCTFSLWKGSIVCFHWSGWGRDINMGAVSGAYGIGETRERGFIL